MLPLNLIIFTDLIWYFAINSMTPVNIFFSQEKRKERSVNYM